MPRDEYAFPIPELNVWEGMGLRDYFAARALDGLLSGLPENYDLNRKVITTLADLAYEMADAMLAARSPDVEDEGVTVTKGEPR